MHPSALETIHRLQTKLRCQQAEHPKRFLQNYLPQNDKDIIVFFQFSDSKHSEKEETYIERVTWAIVEDGYSNFKRFCTSYYPGNSSELLEWIKNHKL